MEFTINSEVISLKMKANTYGVKKKVSIMQASNRIKVVSTSFGPSSK